MGVVLGTYGNNGSGGWTTITASVDTVIYYVSKAAGASDSNTGLAPTFTSGTNGPFLTLAHAMSVLNALTNNVPYWLLLRKGDTWTDEQLGQIKVSGRSATEPLVLSSYDPSNPTVPNPGTGGARPLIKVADGSTGLLSSGAGGGGSGGDYLAVMGLDFYAYTRDPALFPATVGTSMQGIFLLTGSNWLLFEDNAVRFFETNITIETLPALSVAIRRNVITDSYGVSPNSGQGMFLDLVSGLLIEENVLDHNGWNETVSGAGANVFSHNVYLSGGSGVATARGNITARASSHGFQIRPGGTVINNLMVNNTLAGFVGATQSSVNDNVITEGKNIPSSTHATGFAVITGADSSVVTNTITAHVIDVSPADAFQIGTNAANQVTLTIANPCVVTCGEELFKNGQSVVFQNNSDTLPASFSFGTVYYTVNSSSDGHSCSLAATTGGSAISTLGQSQSGTHMLYTRVVGASFTGNIIYQWGSPATITDNGIGSVSSPNDIDSAGPHFGTFPYPDPTRSCGSYNASQGGTATLAAFLAQARLQSKDNWRAAYTADAVVDYIQEGFGIFEAGAGGGGLVGLAGGAIIQRSLILGGMAV